MLKLIRPLIVFDIDSTGVNLATDRISRISVLKVFPDGTREIRSRILSPTDEVESLGTHKGRSLPYPVFKQVAKSLFTYLADCDLCSFNGKYFDVPLLANEFTRLALPFPALNVSHIDVFDIYQMLHPHIRPKTLSAAITRYLGGERSQALSHSNPTIIFNILQAMIDGPLKIYVRENPAEISVEFFSVNGLSAFGNRIHQKRMEISGPKIVGEPSSVRLFHRSYPATQALDELIGICRGILADGEVNENEAFFFAEWTRKNSPTKPIWPFTDILQRVERIFADGICDQQERNELKEVMTQLCTLTQASSSTTKPELLPLDSPFSLLSAPLLASRRLVQ